MGKYPTNYIFLSVFTALYGVILGIVSSMYTLPSVLLAAGLTAGIFLSLTVYAMATTRDFTGCGPYLFVALSGLVLFGFASFALGAFFPHLYSMSRMIYAGSGAVLFSFYIVFNTQLIVGGQHKHGEFSVDDYAFAALSLYLDIINLFLMLLNITGHRR